MESWQLFPRDGSVGQGQGVDTPFGAQEAPSGAQAAVRGTRRRGLKPTAHLQSPSAPLRDAARPYGLDDASRRLGMPDAKDTDEGAEGACRRGTAQEGMCPGTCFSAFWGSIWGRAGWPGGTGVHGVWGW
jgi:hypothetical protein